jgi:hypothetical protein
MRLVSREFEEKVSRDLFHTVVVPFRPEIYDIADEKKEEATPGSHTNSFLRSLNGIPMSPGNPSVVLQDKGMRVFQGFGRHIHRFAMSFELDENVLRNPPMKSDQEAITSFWGIYCWPFQKYHRYTQFEGLERTADETMTMAKAFRFVDNARELGLSIDGGLGWLSGPDINCRLRDQINAHSVPVFGASRFYSEGLLDKENAESCSPGLPLSGNIDIPRRGALEQILREAGYEGEGLAQSLQTLLESEGQTRTSTSYTETYPDVSQSLQPSSSNDDVDNKRQHPFPIVPNDLTNPQKEVLLETEWAQRAFVQSYALAIIDNPNAFENITTLTIARIPSRHLANLKRADFWASLPRLSNINLGVIPDWRDITKLPTGYVEDTRIKPSQSVSEVYQILCNHVSRKASIKTLHFEWLCGGEEAPGLFARNKHILPAPLVPFAMDMINNGPETVKALSLPHIEHLSLKNCWLSPHILLYLTREYKIGILKSLTLRSVSLCAPVLSHDQTLSQLTQYAARNPFRSQNSPKSSDRSSRSNNALVIQPAQATSASNSEGIKAPRGSWADFLDAVVSDQVFKSTTHDLYQESDPMRLTLRPLSIVFDSCGYVRLQCDLDQTMLDPPVPPPGDTQELATRRDALESYMMKIQEQTLGTIINHIQAGEAQILEESWKLGIGWGHECQARMVQSLDDGIRVPGKGRFRGIVLTSSQRL